MQKLNRSIQDKIANHLMINGKKNTSEKLIIRSIKELQKNLKKSHKEIIQLSIINLQPIFKIKKLKNKKTKKKTLTEIPSFIADKKTGISTSIKYILSDLKTKKKKNSYIKLKEEIINSAKNYGKIIQIKNEIQKKVLANKRYLRTYKWN